MIDPLVWRLSWRPLYIRRDNTVELLVSYVSFEISEGFEIRAFTWNTVAVKSTLPPPEVIMFYCLTTLNQSGFNVASSAEGRAFNVKVKTDFYTVSFLEQLLASSCCSKTESRCAELQRNTDLKGLSAYPKYLVISYLCLVTLKGSVLTLRSRFLFIVIRKSTSNRLWFAAYHSRGVSRFFYCSCIKQIAVFFKRCLHHKNNKRSIRWLFNLMDVTCSCCKPKKLHNIPYGKLIAISRGVIGHCCFLGSGWLHEENNTELDCMWLSLGSRQSTQQVVQKETTEIKERKMLYWHSWQDGLLLHLCKRVVSLLKSNRAGDV